MEDKKNISIEEKAEIITEKYDTGATRKLLGYFAIAFTIIAIVLSVFHLYTAGFGLLLSMKQRTIHWMLLLVILFMYFPAAKKSSRVRPSAIDIVLIIGSIISSFYLLFNYESIIVRGGIPTGMDMAMGVIMILITLEATRRAVGKELLIICLAFIAYAALGNYAPGVLAHKGFSLSRIVGQLYLTTEGIFGIPLDVSATYLVLFIFFGAVLKETGLDLFFRDVSLAIAGRIAGGPAQVAVVASGLFGSINGSATANVVSTGTFTIPLMKSVGYQPYFAGAVEAVASTGGQLMPPIMGSAAFIMAEFLGIPYMKIALAALIPALFYYFGCGVMVYFRARKMNLRVLTSEEIPSIKATFKKTGHMIFPLVLLIYLLFIGKTPLFAAFYSIFATIALSYFKKDTRLSLKNYISIAENTAKSMIGVAAACASAGIVIGVVSLTGIGLTLGNNLVNLAGGNIIFMLILTMLVSMVMGMGVPTTVVYILMATITAPPLVALGFEPLAAHMFVFYFALLASVTPPVAIAAYAGAGLAEASPSKTGWQAFRLAIAGFIIPYIFIFSPELLFINADISIFIPITTGLIGIVSLGAFFEGYLMRRLKNYERLILLVAALCLIVPETISDIVGLVLFLIVVLLAKKTASREKEGVL